jgi:hypothetical protein
LTRANRGTIQNVSISGSISGSSSGGVVYSNEGTVENCNFSGSISGDSGGIARQNLCVIRNCYVTGSISSSGSNGTGGIVGVNIGTVQNCYATCTITGGTYIGHNVGGIAGNNSGTVKNCYAIGNITGTKWLGGIVGFNSSDGVIQNCYATGNVTGGDPYVGGIAGSGSGTVQNCYATGNITGEYGIGGITGGTDTVQNRVALNPSLTATSTSFLRDTWRIANNIGGRLNNLLNNYGLNVMTLPSVITVTSDANGVHGADITSAEYNDPSWWQSTAQFPSSAWEFRAGLPVLRDMPAGTQNPVVR